MWTTGSILIKHFKNGSQFGIEGGRISKLFVTREDMVVLNYDRGWDTEAQDEGTEFCLAILIKEYN